MTNIEYMRQEIGVWRAEGLVSAELGERLLGRYEKGKRRFSWGVVFLSAFAALLVGLGVISVFAANWEEMGRATRAFVSVAPTIICALFAMLAERKGWKSAAVREPLGILWTIATIAGTALVAQTYNLGGSVPDLVLLVTFLTLPIVWITRSATLIGAWPILAFVWATAREATFGSDLLVFWTTLGLMTLSVPALVLQLRSMASHAEKSVSLLFSGMAYGVFLPISFFLSLNHATEMTITLVFWCSALILGSVGYFAKLPVWPPWAVVISVVTSAPIAFNEYNIPFFFYFIALAQGLIVMLAGALKRNLAFANLGAILLVWLVVIRFMSSSLPFVQKGMILIGAGVFLAAVNILVVKAGKEAR